MNAEDLKKIPQPDGAAIRPGPASGERFPTDEMLTPTELAVRLKTAVRTVEKWRHRRILLAITVDKVVLFYWPSVVARLLEKFQDREPEDRGQRSEDRGQKSEVRKGTESTPHPGPLPGRGGSNSAGLRQPSPASGDGPALAARVKKLHRGRS
jgi:hypothetical protein